MPGFQSPISVIRVWNFESADSKNLLRIVLKEDTKVLDEVVVVGYGVQKRKVISPVPFLP